MKFFDKFVKFLRDRQELQRFTKAGIYRRAVDNMAPGVLTVEGFFSETHSRSLALVLSQDASAFRTLGLNWDRVASRLDELLHKGAEGLGNAMTVDDEFLVQVAETRGSFPCPWEDGMFRKRSATIQRLDASKKLVGPQLLVSDLSIHLIKEHHFLQGPGTTFRLEPKDLREVLGASENLDD